MEAREFRVFEVQRGGPGESEPLEMKSNSLRLFKSFRVIAATPGGLGQGCRTGKEREPLRKEVVFSYCWEK